MSIMQLTRLNKFLECYQDPDTSRHSRLLLREWSGSWVSYDLIQFNVWASKRNLIRIFLGPSISRVSGVGPGPAPVCSTNTLRRLSRVLAVPVLTSPASRARWRLECRVFNQNEKTLATKMLGNKWTIGAPIKIISSKHLFSLWYLSALTMRGQGSTVLLLVLYLHLEVHGEPEAAPRARSSG